MTDMIGGRRPWLIATEPVEFITQGGATQAEIDICLSCDLPERLCRGESKCYKIKQFMTPKKEYAPRTTLVYDYQVVEMAIAAPGTHAEKCRKLGISTQTYIRWRKKYYAEKSAKEAI